MREAGSKDIGRRKGSRGWIPVEYSTHHRHIPARPYECYNRSRPAGGSRGLGCSVEKLEEILKAEEAARHALSSARERAAEIRREAATDAELITGTAVRDATAEAETLASGILREAEAEAARIIAHGETSLGEVLATAESRFEMAVDAAVRSVEG